MWAPKIAELVQPCGIQSDFNVKRFNVEHVVRGPNDVWHIDGYNKPKPFGFATHGAINGYIRHILWLEVGQSNNDPQVVAQYFVDYMKKIGGTARRICGDCRTENCFIEIENCQNSTFPASIKRRSVPFINEDIKEQIFIKNNVHKIALRTGLVEDWNGFKQQRCKAKLALKAAEVEYYNEQIFSNQYNCASLWKTIRNALPTKPHCSLKYTKEKSALAEEFN